MTHVEMQRTSRRRAGAAVVLAFAFALVLVAAGCSGGATFGSAAGSPGVSKAAAASAPVGAALASGRNTDGLNPDSFCNDDYKIQLCFLLVNRTTVFSGPFQVNARVPLTVNRFCSGNGYPPELGAYSGTGCWGKLACWNRTGEQCEGRLTPNPFTDVAGMLFVNNGATSGVSPTLFVSGDSPPFAGAGTAAKAYFDSPYNGTNNGAATNGTYIAAELDTTSFQPSTWMTRPRFIFTTRPVRVRVQNSAQKVTLKLDGQPLGSNFLVDPTAMSKNAESISTYTSGYFGGYRAVSGASSLTLQFVVADANGGTAVTPDCPGCGQQVVATFSYDPNVKGSKPTAASKCEVTGSSRTARYVCDKSRVDGTDQLLTFTIDFREEGM